MRPDDEVLAARWNQPRRDRPVEWRCWCGRLLGCPAALDAHQFDHGSTAFYGTLGEVSA